MGFYKKIKGAIGREGFAGLLYKISTRIDYPRNGFPRYGVDGFMRTVAKRVKPGMLVLDAGAGDRPYRKLFSHSIYHSCDFMPVLAETGGNTEIGHTFYCDLENIPKEEGIYDTVICNQVLEHVRDPRKVICELHRILKAGGRLYLTTPQCAGIHMPPHHYFNYTRYGLELLFKNAGFRIESIQPLGGIFWLSGKCLQKAYEAVLKKIGPSFRLIYLPVHLFARIILACLSFLFFHLDKLDTDRDWTPNYGCCCIKEEVQCSCIN